MQPSTLGLDAQSAGTHVPFYWGGALVGRFIGAALLRLPPPCLHAALTLASRFLPRLPGVLKQTRLVKDCLHRFCAPCIERSLRINVMWANSG